VNELRYHKEVIDNPADFDAIEIQGVRNVGDDVAEVDNDNPEFYSTYVHMKTGGVQCVGDHPTLEEAQAYAEELSAQYGYPIYCYTE
jgi:hypothetical protein